MSVKLVKKALYFSVGEITTGSENEKSIHSLQKSRRRPSKNTANKDTLDREKIVVNNVKKGENGQQRESISAKNLKRIRKRRLMKTKVLKKVTRLLDQQRGSERVVSKEDIRDFRRRKQERKLRKLQRESQFNIRNIPL